MKYLYARKFEFENIYHSNVSAILFIQLRVSFLSYLERNSNRGFGGYSLLYSESTKGYIIFSFVNCPEGMAVVISVSLSLMSNKITTLGFVLSSSSRDFLF
jgi:hypothetical protein